MTRRIALALALTLSASGSALAADPIQGRWKTNTGSTAQISPCGAAFCITLVSGPHAGKRIGNMQASGGAKYAGTIIDPNDDKSYSGTASLAGSSLRLSGCVLGGIICRSQTWSRQ
jgi:uncharacterized protein (DUF2147 family)